jgi:transketolase
MPCTRRFDRQSLAYRQEVLPPSLPIVAVEAGHPDLWWKYVGSNGAVVGIDRFGESAPAAELFTSSSASTFAASSRRCIDCSGNYRRR